MRFALLVVAISAVSVVSAHADRYSRMGIGVPGGSQPNQVITLRTKTGTVYTNAVIVAADRNTITFKTTMGERSIPRLLVNKEDSKAIRDKARESAQEVKPKTEEPVADTNTDFGAVESAAEFLQRLPETPVVMDCVVKLSAHERSEGNYVLELRDAKNVEIGYGIISTVNEFAKTAWPMIRDGEEHKAKVLLSYRPPNIPPGTVRKYSRRMGEYSRTHFMVHEIKMAP